MNHGNFDSLQLYGFVVMVNVNSDFFQLFALPSDTKSAITFEWVELVENKLHSLDIYSIGFHMIIIFKSLIKGHKSLIIRLKDGFLIEGIL